MCSIRDPREDYDNFSATFEDYLLRRYFLFFRQSLNLINGTAALDVRNFIRGYRNQRYRPSQRRNDANRSWAASAKLGSGGARSYTGAETPLQSRLCVRSGAFIPFLFVWILCVM